MHKLILTLALLPASLSPAAIAQSVSIKTGPNGQLTGSATAGGTSSSVGAGSGRTFVRGPARNLPCAPGRTSRSIRVVSPGGSSSSAVSVSGGGTVAVGGGGSQGTRIYEQRCGGGGVHRAVAHRRPVHRRARSR